MSATIFFFFFLFSFHKAYFDALPTVTGTQWWLLFSFMLQAAVSFRPYCKIRLYYSVPIRPVVEIFLFVLPFLVETHIFIFINVLYARKVHIFHRTLFFRFSLHCRFKSTLKYCKIILCKGGPATKVAFRCLYTNCLYAVYRWVRAGII